MVSNVMLLLLRGACRATISRRIADLAHSDLKPLVSAARQLSSTGLHELDEKAADMQDALPEAEWEPEDGHLHRQRLWTSACPFTVHRTASDNIPVYVFKRKNRTEAVTVIRKVRGNVDELRKELECLCQCRFAYGKNGFLEAVGNHRKVIKAYLKSIGY
mmetsp:Transcript_139974/g.390216  ORF Transcript_139974/g.390216 Transcript_139974/m.390216 type:complete len:160 (-) Transcript_139974:381-860(-)